MNIESVSIMNPIAPQLQRHPLGFFQIAPLPSQEELEKYYRDQYFQAPTVTTYSRKYSQEELTIHQVACDVADHIFEIERPDGQKTVFDIGCGEGFFLKGMKSLGWNVSGTDYSSEGVTNHNPELLPDIKFGSALEIIEQVRKTNRQFGLVNLGNILEHVLDPLAFLESVRPLLGADSLLRVVVPNDASEFQTLLESLGCTGRPWIHPPDHLSYFNFDCLPAVLASCRFTPIRMLGDFPIELYLLNKYSNYDLDKSRGPEAHLARVRTVHFVRSRGIANYVRWAEGLAAGAVARSCIAFAKLAD